MPEATKSPPDQSSPLIAVASRSFSASDELRQRLLEEFPNCRFNDEGARLGGTALTDFLQGANGIIVGVEPLDSQVLESLPALRVISKYGVGLDSIDVSAVERLGITLATAKGTNSAAAAEVALFLMLGSLRRVPEALRNVREHAWKGVSGNLLHGKTVGIVGVGNVAHALVPLLRAFDCSILGYDERPSSASDVKMVRLEELLRESDVVTLHLPLTAKTASFMNHDRLAMMKPTSILINTSRGGLVDQEALQQALLSSSIAAAGLDVLVDEPPTDWGIVELPNALVTPHIGGSSIESNRAMGLAAIAGLVQHRTLLA